jgi:hypothetical protein
LPARVVIRTRKSPRNIIDIAAAALLVNDAPRGQLVGEERNIDGDIDITAQRTVCGRRGAAVHHRLGHVELRFVREVAHHARLGARAEQGALRALQDLDPLEIRGVNVQITLWQLRGLLIEVHRDVRETADDTRTLQARWEDSCKKYS